MPTFKSTLRLAQPAKAIVASLLLSSAAQAAPVPPPSDDWTSMIYSPYMITAGFVIIFIALVVYKVRAGKRQKKSLAPAQAKTRSQATEKTLSTPVAAASADPSSLAERVVNEKAPQVQPWEKPVEVKTSVYGAYRIDQEVAKLALGKPHRMDVMSSRARDDRQAIEASLIKALEASDTSKEGCSRIRAALEEYGFVARQSATMLMGRDAWERSSAARVLGQIGAPSSLPFLIEALHDNDSVVRNQAIASLGLLKVPSAIGALLDIARRHPDIPASLLSETLSECSVENFGFLDLPSSEPAAFAADGTIAEPGDLDKAGSFAELPDGGDDEELNDALSRLTNPDDYTRSVAAQELALHRNQRSVSALTSLVIKDSDAAVRSAAVASLGSLDHESVLPAVLIALADESRIVRAAAARTLSGLHCDRADAYVRVQETDDRELLSHVAKACVKTGIAAQALERLISEDRHQAYEAFSLFSLLARANETDPILDAIKTHRDEEVRLCAIRVLNVAGDSSLVPKLRELAGHDGMSENVRTALLEVLYKMDQGEPLMDLAASDNVPMTLHNS
jgi:HEAT repeat protein